MTLPEGHYVHRQEEPAQKWVIKAGINLLDADPHVWVYSDGPCYTYSVIFNVDEVTIEFSDGVATGSVVMMTDDYMERTIIWDECEIIEKERALSRAVKVAESLLTKHSTG